MYRNVSLVLRKFHFDSDFGGYCFQNRTVGRVCTVRVVYAVWVQVYIEDDIIRVIVDELRS